ncbi:inositol monophosphatase [Halobaculum sp. MBLA0147]|uniref:inositol monophosphatase family protein n=1 Tax=Halobaculum sp. MBLA0147 TaxID=3079934 RepID=UPI003524ADE2
MTDSDEVPAPSVLAETAETAARAAGDTLRDGFRDGVDATYGEDDVKAAADRRAERRAVETIRERYPGHAVDSEEREPITGGPVEWLVDPLDGTNNYAVGHPAFAVAVTARRLASDADEPRRRASDADGRTGTGADGRAADGDLLAAAVYEPLPEECAVAVRGEGAHVGRRRLAADHDRPLARSTVSLVLGIDAVRDERLRRAAETVRERLADRSKRVLESWAPCLDWTLFARGSLAGVVCVHPDEREQAPGALLASEAGAATAWDGDCFLAAPTEERLATLQETLPETL